MAQYSTSSVSSEHQTDRLTNEIQQRHQVTDCCPKLRQARDDIQTSRVKRNAVETHDTASSVTPSLHQQLLLLLQNLYSAQIQASSSQRRWRIAKWGTWLAGVGKEVSFETAFERANGW